MDKIIDELRFNDGRFPREALERAIEEKDAITPYLLESLDEVLEDPTIATERGDYMLHLYSLYLLAQFREKAAFPKIIELISLAPDDVEFMLDDTITEGLPSILYSTYNGDLALLERTIEDPQVQIYVRSSVLHVVGKLYLDGVVSHEYLVTYLRQLLAAEMPDQETEIDFNTFIQMVVYDCSLSDMLEDIRILYEEDRIDETMYGDFDQFANEVHDKKGRSYVRYIDDVIQEMHWWACFEEPSSFTVNQPYVRGEKVGRNDPCPCGSGKKHKKCCGA